MTNFFRNRLNAKTCGYLLVSLLPFVYSIGYSQSNPDEFFSKADIFFKQYVKEGNIDYTALQTNRPILDSLSRLIGVLDISRQPEVVRKAYWINVYNVLVIKSVVDNYPITSPKDVPGFFDNAKHKIGGELLTLNEIEKDILLKNFKDGRLHFALVCGARGCPPITSFAYTPALLDSQLDIQIRSALNDPQFIRLDHAGKEVELSEIFNWYESDFTSEQGTVLKFINNYKTTSIPENYSIRYYPYDWSLNSVLNTGSEQVITQKTVDIQKYTPSVLLNRGQWEFKFFNNLYTQTKGFDDKGKTVNYNARGTYFTSISQILIGITPHLNLGAELWVKSARNDLENSSPLSLFKFGNNNMSRTSLTGIGPKIKIAPFSKLPRLSIQSTFLVPVTKNLEGTSASKLYVSEDSYLSITQFLYDQPLGKKFQLFLQLSPWIYIDRKFEKNGTYVSVSETVFLSYFPNNKITLYLQGQYWPTFGGAFISSSFVQPGIGAKYQLVPGLLELETLYTKFIAGKNSGGGETFNLGVRLLH